MMGGISTRDKLMALADAEPACEKKTKGEKASPANKPPHDSKCGKGREKRWAYPGSLGASRMLVVLRSEVC